MIEPSGPFTRSSASGYGLPTAGSLAGDAAAPANSQKPFNSILNSDVAAATGDGEPRYDESDMRAAFDEFVGQTFFGSMLASMRKTVDKPAYMHGGRGEEVFQQQLDEKLVQELTKSSASQISGPMYDLFQTQRGG